MPGVGPVPLSNEERARLRQKFASSLCTIQSMLVYWSPALRQIYARSEQAMKRHVLPDDAVHVGRYGYPCNPDDFLGDLDAVLARLEHQAQQRRRR